MKSLSDLWRELADELASWCHTSTTRDFKTVTSRVEKEGLSFLTISLPSFCKDFERSLELGKVDSDLFCGFRKRGGLPAFLSGFLCQIFDPQSGELLTDPSVDCIFAVRQLTRLFAKIELPCSDARITRAMEEYVSCEKEVADWESNVSQVLLAEFRDMSRLLFSEVFTIMDKIVYNGDLVPRHGPGSTADRLQGNQKFVQQTWTTRLESVFPYGEYAIPNWRYYYLLDDVNFLEPGQEIPVKVIPVPKTLKTPRIIAMEPSYMQYMQQAVLRPLIRELENPRSLPSEFLGFSDQVPNQMMARDGSLYGELATLDLKEASDRVSNVLVNELVHDFPWFANALQATRSTKAEIAKLGMSIPKLHKFASMGSALCFPVEAMVFLTVIMIGIQRRANSPLRRRDIQSLRGKVRVYGDDIIVPADCVVSVTRALEDFGFRVNTGKSFWNGKFRESCGADYYDGQDVRPVYLRDALPRTLKDASSLASFVAFRNQIYSLGLWHTASKLDDFLFKILKGYFPIVEKTSPLLGRQSVLPYEVERVDADTQSPLVRGFVLKPRIPSNSIGDAWALLKCLTSDVTFEDEKHLERSGRPSVVDIKLRWMAPF